MNCEQMAALQVLILHGGESDGESVFTYLKTMEGGEYDSTHAGQALLTTVGASSTVRYSV
jgi:hypothetical protein